MFQAHLLFYWSQHAYTTKQLNSENQFNFLWINLFFFCLSRSTCTIKRNLRDELKIFHTIYKVELYYNYYLLFIFIIFASLFGVHFRFFSSIHKKKIYFDVFKFYIIKTFSLFYCVLCDFDFF